MYRFSAMERLSLVNFPIFQRKTRTIQERFSRTGSSSLDRACCVLDKIACLIISGEPNLLRRGSEAVIDHRDLTHYAESFYSPGTRSQVPHQKASLWNGDQFILKIPSACFDVEQSMHLPVV